MINASLTIPGAIMRAPFTTRSRIRYRLKTLLMVMTVVAIIGAVFGNYWRAIQREERALRQIAIKGGEIHRAWSGGVVVVRFEPSGHHSCGRTQVIAPRGDAFDFVDKDLSLLDELRGLQAVYFSGSG